MHDSSESSRPRTSYAITDAGREAVRSWLTTAPRPTALECEPLLRLFLLDPSTKEDVLTALAQVEADARAVLDVGRVVGPEYLAGIAPFQDQVPVRAFVFDFLSCHALALLAWAERTRGALAAWPSLTDQEREERAKALVKTRLEDYPAG